MKALSLHHMDTTRSKASDYLSRFVHCDWTLCRTISSRESNTHGSVYSLKQFRERHAVPVRGLHPMQMAHEVIPRLAPVKGSRTRRPWFARGAIRPKYVSLRVAPFIHVGPRTETGTL